MPPSPDATTGKPPRRRRLARWTAGLVLLLVLGLAGAALWAHGRLRASLPQLDGERALPGLAAPVVVERDELGVPTVRGDGRPDVARALGFLHGQERFFQMDLLRRQAAGELAELFGAGLLAHDRRARLHRFRDRARRRLASLPEGDRRLLDAYAAGVREGVGALGARPWEYLVLRLDPAPWQPEDSVLAVYAMYFALNDENGGRESSRGLIRDLLGAEMLDFLDPWGTEWDAPLVGEPFASPPVPGSAAFDLRERPTGDDAGRDSTPAAEPERPSHGSNNWAVAGERSAHGGALVANDMHLGHSVPNIWYRAVLVYPDAGAPGGERRLAGVTLPGAPAVVAGSNGQIAWGLTNTYGDWTDLVVLEPAGDDGHYRTPVGVKPVRVEREVLRVKGGESEMLEVAETIWGPVVDRDHRGRQRALRWIAHSPRGANLEMLRLESAATVDEALAIAQRVGGPPQNFVVGDAQGRVGWTVMGSIPRRFGHDGRVPTSWADGTRGWNGWLEPGEYPRLADPDSGRIWSANNRLVDGEMLASIGQGGLRLGARARQIRDRLLAAERVSEADLLAIQLDDRALFLERWQSLLLDLLTVESLVDDPRRGELRGLVESWGARAAVDSPGYRLVRGFRQLVWHRAFAPLLAPCREADQRFDYLRLNQNEGPLWRLVTERPAHLLDPTYDSWEALLLDAADATIEHFTRQGAQLAEQTWGGHNTVRIRHPVALPGLGRWLHMPASALPGDSFMPRFQSSVEGASERMVVSPGREEEGIFHMPGGQSGHPLSPHYRAGHEAWVRGEPTPFLPGPVRHTLTLAPQPPE